MPTSSFRLAQLALREALAHLDAYGDTHRWPADVYDARLKVRGALHYLASADAGDFERWLTEEQCATCGADADVVSEWDGAAYCAHHYERLREREREQAERDAGYETGHNAASDMESRR